MRGYRDHEENSYGLGGLTGRRAGLVEHHLAVRVPPTGTSPSERITMHPECSVWGTTPGRMLRRWRSVPPQGKANVNDADAGRIRRHAPRPRFDRRAAGLGADDSVTSGAPLKPSGQPAQLARGTPPETS
jgi:hypothetical protein